MTFWNASELEPKRNFRWIASIELFSGKRRAIKEAGSIQNWTVTSFSPPKFNLETDQQIGPLGRLFTQQKNSKWDDVNIVMHDLLYPIDKETLSFGLGEADGGDANNTSILYDWLVANGYSPEKSMIRMLTQLDKKWLMQLVVARLGTAGKVAEAWTFYRPILQSIEFGSAFDYNSADLSQVTMKIRPTTCAYRFVPY